MLGCQEGQSLSFHLHPTCVSRCLCCRGNALSSREDRVFLSVWRDEHRARCLHGACCLSSSSICREGVAGSLRQQHKKGFLEHDRVLQRRRSASSCQTMHQASRPEAQTTSCSCWMKSLRLRVFVLTQFLSSNFHQALTGSHLWSSRL